MKAKFVPKTELVLQSKKRRRNFWFEINGWNICRESEQQFPEIFERKSFHCLFHRRHFTFFLPFFWELFFFFFYENWVCQWKKNVLLAFYFLVFREKKSQKDSSSKNKNRYFALEIINYIFSQTQIILYSYLTIQCLSSFNLLPSLFSWELK